MLRRFKTGGLRKKPEKPKAKPIEDIQIQLKKVALTIFIWLLVVANLIFVVSMIFQILNATSGEKVVKAKKTTSITKSTSGRIKVEVLNGCGINKLAARLRNYLIDKNYDVVDFRDYERFDIPETLVIDRKSMNTRYAQKVADAIGVKRKQTLPLLNPQRKLDVSVIIGKDYKDLKAFK